MVVGIRVCTATEAVPSWLGKKDTGRSAAKESTGVLLNRMAPEIVQAARQRLEAIGCIQKDLKSFIAIQTTMAIIRMKICPAVVPFGVSVSDRSKRQAAGWVRNLHGNPSPYVCRNMYLFPIRVVIVIMAKEVMATLLVYAGIAGPAVRYSGSFQSISSVVSL